MITITHYLVLSSIIFVIGMYGLLTRKSAVSLYMCIELIFNAANINFVAFSHFVQPASLAGQIFSLFIIAISAAEFGVGIAIILLLYRRARTVNVKEVSVMRG